MDKQTIAQKMAQYFQAQPGQVRLRDIIRELPGAANQINNAFWSPTVKPLGTMLDRTAATTQQAITGQPAPYVPAVAQSEKQLYGTPQSALNTVMGSTAQLGGLALGAMGAPAQAPQPNAMSNTTPSLAPADADYMKRAVQLRQAELEAQNTAAMTQHPSQAMMGAEQTMRMNAAMQLRHDGAFAAADKIEELKPTSFDSPEDLNAYVHALKMTLPKGSPGIQTLNNWLVTAKEIYDYLLSGTPK